MKKNKINHTKKKRETEKDLIFVETQNMRSLTRKRLWTGTFIQCKA